MFATLEMSRKKTLAALNSSAIAVPIVMIMSSASASASAPPASGTQPSQVQAITMITSCGSTW
ncbi:MAG: hypothetical protein JWP82_1000 [Humibacillus sp.]|nr:hypothetical protein [Humibacillus sp.]